MLIIDIGTDDGQDRTSSYALDENNLVYAIASTPDLARQLQTNPLPNRRVFCLTSLGEGSPPGILTLGLNDFMAQQAIVEVDLLRIANLSLGLSLIQSADDSIHRVRRIQFEQPNSPKEDESVAVGEIIGYLEASGFRVVSSQPPILEFVRVHRYAQNQSASDVFEADIPHIGVVATPKHDLVGRLLEQHLFEGPEQAFLWLYLRPGDTFFDCGAHVGAFSCIAAQQLQNQGQIVGFEPNPQNLTLYCQNLKAIDCSCYTAMAVGLSDQAGEAPFFLGKDGLSAYGTFAKGAIGHAEIGQESLMVRQVTLDSVIESLGIAEVTLSKLDVEGWEVPVLLGATEAIGKGIFPVWMIEFTEENAAAAGSSTQELAKVIENFGYTLCRFDATQFRLVPEVKRSSYGYENLFAVINIDRVNERLESASLANKSIAKDIISRWDLASKAEEARAFSAALQKLSHAFESCKADSANRLEQIQTLSHALEACEVDSADRFEQIQTLSHALEVCEVDSADRFEQIQKLSQWLQEEMAINQQPLRNKIFNRIKELIARRE